MGKVYVLSKRKDAELEQAIHNMDAYHLRIALYGVARGWQFDDAVSIAEEAAQQTHALDAATPEPKCTTERLCPVHNVWYASPPRK